jgi:ferredoxin
MLETYRAVGGIRPRVVLHDDAATPEQLVEDEGVLPVALHAVAATGPETWLACLAWGAVEVLLAPSEDAPESTHSLIREQVELSGQLLAAVGHEPGRIRLLTGKDTGAKTRGTELGELPLLDVAPSKDRHRLLLAAVAALGDGRGLGERITLPAGAGAGAVAVDEAACTLCFACANLCPTRALRRDRNARPVLLFTEEACVQCGICARACPEHAVQLLPSLLLDPSRRESARPLAEGEMAHCANCGQAYLPRTVLAAALSRAKVGTLLQDDTARLLELCPACRAERIMHTEFRPAIPGRWGDRGP